ncbi:LysM peptidoglycan-binding domain-containing protein [Robiginitalea sediminis]|uniref:LysM peptidoglycan-binding domain-containing protein n=1 Tax=Robiginitalea sediminis TaxID=1982593 RepID=UPI000B4B4734|nr:LysM domain-containing protein [Robiginitalea sediminis]
MNAACRYLLAGLFALLLSGPAWAQQQFRTHAVQEGETVSSIARRYGLTPADLIRHNKELEGGATLKPNTLLVIPRREAVAATNVASAQDSTDLSKPIGFVTHRVKRKETLFSITRRYEVEEEEIKRYNPQLYGSDLQRGMVIRIPRFAPGYREQQEVESQLTTYTVLPKETRWSIAHKFGIPMDSLLSLNPELPRSTSYLAAGQELRVPKPAEAPEMNQQTELYRSYTVPPKQTLFSLSQEFGISREEIIRLNPEIMERGNLQEGMVLRLPEKKLDTTGVHAQDFVFYEVKPKQTEFSLTRKFGLGWDEMLMLNPDLELGLKAGMVLKIPREKAEGLEVKNTLVLDAFDLKDSINTQHIPRLLVMLPFRLDRLDLQNQEETFKRVQQNNALTYALGIYSGLMVALDSVAELGVSVEVRALDTQLRPERVRQLLLQEDLSRYSAVLGPLDPRSVQEVATRASELDLPVVAPVPVPSAVGTENVFYTYTDEGRLRQRMLQYMQATVTDQNIFIISDQKNREVEARILEAFPAAELVALKQDDENISLDMEAFVASLSEERENWVFVETGDFRIASSVTSILNSANTETTPVRMFTTNRSAFDNEVVSATHLSNLKFTYPSVNREVAESAFTKRYRRRFGAEPDRYAVRGFDLGMDLLLRLAYKPDLFEAADQIGNTRYSGNMFNYVKELQSGYFNTASYIMMYEGLRLREIQGP